MKENQTPIIGFLKKQYQKDTFLFTSKSGNEYARFTISSKKPGDDKYTYRNCIAFHEQTISNLEKLEGQLVETNSYKQETNEYQDKTYYSYIVNNIYAHKKLEEKQQENSKSIEHDMVIDIPDDNLPIMPF
jgi:hypothetical protein